ncbi:DUF1289 domain-containing protein [Sneathiella glossodoripedis]|uniref:DUF1289 domain-containing protein n=1 Tax=Sneathiella glossodoripedis TaxID=418853 RepID=UPI0004710283|nr:DUF1289 domain-containing protein [Sneathiella glossodoripedis]
MHRRVITKAPKGVTIPSPCTGVCTMDMKNEYCIGCFRTRLEIGGWMHLGNDEKLKIIKELRGRREKAKES